MCKFMWMCELKERKKNNLLVLLMKTFVTLPLDPLKTLRPANGTHNLNRSLVFLITGKCWIFSHCCTSIYPSSYVSTSSSSSSPCRCTSISLISSCCCRYPSLSLWPKRLWNFPLGKTMHVCFYKGRKWTHIWGIDFLFVLQETRPNLRARWSMRILIKPPDVPPDWFDSAGRNHHQVSLLIQQCLATQVGWWDIWFPLGLSSTVWYV